MKLPRKPARMKLPRRGHRSDAERFLLMDVEGELNEVSVLPSLRGWVPRRCSVGQYRPGMEPD